MPEHETEILDVSNQGIAMPVVLRLLFFLDRQITRADADHLLVSAWPREEQVGTLLWNPGIRQDNCLTSLYVDAGFFSDICFSTQAEGSSHSSFQWDEFVHMVDFARMLFLLIPEEVRPPKPETPFRGAKRHARFLTDAYVRAYAQWDGRLEWLKFQTWDKTGDHKETI